MDTALILVGAKLWLATLVMGMISWPATRLFFSSLSDQGYTIAKLLGWLATGYLMFIVTLAGLVPLTTKWFLVIVGFWAGANLLIASRAESRHYQIIEWRQVLLTELLFIGLLATWLSVRLFGNPIMPSELFTDFSILQHLLITTQLPFEDVWMAGMPVNYYYFGQFIGSLIARIAGIDAFAAFFALPAWIVAQLGTHTYRIGHDLFAGLVKQSGWWQAPLAGLLSLMSALLLGSLYEAGYFMANFASLWLGNGSPLLWPDSVHAIAGANIYPPAYLHFAMTLRPMTWGLLLTAVVASALLVIVTSKKYRLPQTTLLSGWLLGLLALTISWDAPLMALFISLFFLFHYWRRPLCAVQAITVVAVISLATKLPWFVTYTPPVGGFGFVYAGSSVWSWLLLWSSFIFVISYFLYQFIKQKGYVSHKKIILFMAAISVTALLGLLITELAYVKDVLQHTPLYRFNVMSKMTNQIRFVLSLLYGPMIIWIIVSQSSVKKQYIAGGFLALLITAQLIYPINLSFMHSDWGKQNSLAGTEWLHKKHPQDYELYKNLRNLQESLPTHDKIRTLVESEGEIFTSATRFSTFLGWPTVIGWRRHELSWRGDEQLIDERRRQVREFYTTASNKERKMFLARYSIDYVIVGEVEKERYGNTLQTEALRSLGSTVFENDDTFIVAVSGRALRETQ